MSAGKVHKYVAGAEILKADCTLALLRCFPSQPTQTELPRAFLQEEHLSLHVAYGHVITTTATTATRTSASQAIVPKIRKR